MANTIVLRKSSTAGAAPSASTLVAGELAINTADGALFTKLQDGSVYTLIPRLNDPIVNQTISASRVTAGTFPSGSFSIQNLTVTGTLTATASSAVQLSTARTFQLTGDVTGSTSSDLSSGLSLAVTLGTVGVSKGGTGLTTTPSSGQLLIGNGSGFTLSMLTAGAGVTITNAAGSITIAAPPRIGTATCSTTTALNFADADIVRVTLTQSTTFTFAGAVDGQKIILELTQDNSGNRSVVWPASVAYPTQISSIVLSTGANKRDRVGFIYNSASGKYDLVAVTTGY